MSNFMSELQLHFSTFLSSETRNCDQTEWVPFAHQERGFCPRFYWVPMPLLPGVIHIRTNISAALTCGTAQHSCPITAAAAGRSCVGWAGKDGCLQASASHTVQMLKTTPWAKCWASKCHGIYNKEMHWKQSFVLQRNSKEPVTIQSWRNRSWTYCVGSTPVAYTPLQHH